MAMSGVQDNGDRDESEKQALQPWMSGEKTWSLQRSDWKIPVGLGHGGEGRSTKLVNIQITPPPNP